MVAPFKTKIPKDHERQFSAANDETEDLKFGAYRIL